MYYLAPSGPPVNITLISITKNTLNITWLPPNPLDANGVITGYHVIFNRTRINDISSYLLTPSHNYFFKKGMNTLIIDNLYYHCTGLYSYETISFKVAAKTDVGLGPFSTELFFQTNEESEFHKYQLKRIVFNSSKSTTITESKFI